MSFLSVRGMTSWKPKTNISGRSTVLRSCGKKLTFSSDPLSSFGRAESIFQEQTSALIWRNEQYRSCLAVIC